MTVLWLRADTGVWALSVTGILGVLAAIAVAGLVKSGDPSWRLVREAWRWPWASSWER